MILLQSYQYISFSPEVTKIKVCNALRLFSKRFERQLFLHLNKVIKQQLIISKKNQKILTEDEGQQGETEVVDEVLGDRGVLEEGEGEEQGDICGDVVEKVSVEYYARHVSTLNDIFRETLTRFLGYLLTLITEYE